MKNKYLILVLNVYQDIIANFQLEIEDLLNMPNNPTVEDVAEYYVKDMFGRRKDDPKSDDEWYEFQVINLDKSKVVEVQEDLNVKE